MAKAQKPEIKITEQYDVSYAELRPEGNWQDSIQKIATAINVQFKESSELLPFVPSRQFPGLMWEEKIFLVGPSGSGKSRTIIELLRGKDSSYDRIFVINPSNPAGLDSKRENISQLSRKFGRGDLVIWDNFPDGLVKRDLQSAFGALEVVNATPVQNMYIALKPSYLEAYRGLTSSIPDIYTFEITCDLDAMKSLLKSYGSLDKYRDAYRHVAANTDRIARILWQKQPLSLTVVDYYKALLGRMSESSLDDQAALQMASSWLPAYDYFERQFEVIKGLPWRGAEVEFLFVLRFCYEVGLDRTQVSLASLQKGIFGSEAPAEPTRQLGTWLYLSGQNYAMHDSAKNAIKLTDFARMKIASYLSENFAQLVHGGDGELYSLGLFVGRNLEFVGGEKGRTIPEQIYSFMKTSAVFERAVGRGVGDVFERLDDSLQANVLELVDTEIEFGGGLAESLGERFIELDESNRARIMDQTHRGMLFARYFGQSVGRLYSRLPSELRSLVMSHADRNPQFGDGLGMGLGYVYATLDTSLQGDVLTKTRTSYEIARGVGFGFGLTAGMLSEEQARGVFEMADSNSELDTGFGMGIAASYPSLPDSLCRIVLDRVASDCEFAFGVGVYCAYIHKDSCPPELFSLLPKNSEVAYGLGLGFGPVFFYLPEKFRAELDLLLAENFKLDDGVGSGIGLVLKHFPAPAQEMFFAKASARNAFATGLGYGLGYTWRYVGEDLRKRAVVLAGSNSDFARGLGSGFGSHLDYLEPEYREQALSLANGNGELDFGLGAGASWAWPYFSGAAKLLVAERIAARPEFARGFASGVARVVKQFTPELKAAALAPLQSDPFFAEGFGEGTGQYTWSTRSSKERLEFLQQASGSPGMARGLGAGIGLLFSYFEEDISGGGALHPFMKKDPTLRMGVGLGMGRSFKYLPQASRVKAYGMAESDADFAAGLGEGVGTVYNYLDQAERDHAVSLLGDNAFSRGFGKGIGKVFQFLADDARSKFISLAGENSQLAMGLGSGAAANISYMPESASVTLLKAAEKNPFLACGIGEGCGLIFLKLSKPKLDWLAGHCGMEGFAYGLGFGLGQIGKYVDKMKLGEAARLARGDGFAEGYAAGLASVSAHLPEDLVRQVLAENAGDPEFARNFGFGLARVFSQLDSDQRRRMISIAGGSDDFMAGLGEGLGFMMPLTGSRIAQEMVPSSLPSFLGGSAVGAARAFHRLDFADAFGILEYAATNAEYGKVLGRTLAERIGSLDEETQLHVINSLQKDSAFSREFAAALGSKIGGLPSRSQKRVNELMAEFQHLRPLAEQR